MAHGIGNFSANHDIGNGKTAAGLQHAKRLAQDAVLVGGEVDDAVGDDDVDGVVRKRDILDLAFEELDVVSGHLALIFPRERQHLIRHVEPVGLACRAHPASRKKDIDSTTGPEIEHVLSRLEFGQCGRVAAAQGRQQCRFGKGFHLGLVVEIGCNGTDVGHGCRAAA